MNKILFAVIVLATSVGLLASCYTAKKAHKQVGKAIVTYPTQTAKQLRERWPLVSTSTDTINTIDTLYDFIEVQCPDSVYYRVDSFETIEAVRVPVYVKVKQPRIRETREVTIRIKDSATVYICEQELTKSVKTISDLSKKVKKRGKVILWLVIAVALLTAWNFRRFIKLPI